MSKAPIINDHSVVTVEKKLGKIKAAKFGWGGYQDTQVGLSLELGGESWGVMHFDGGWGIERSGFAKWTEEERVLRLGEVVMRTKDLLTKAKVTSVDQLVGVPVEIEFDGFVMLSFRILTEVL